MHKGDRTRELILQILDSAISPLETPEIVAKVQEKIPKSTRTIVFKRLADLRGDGLIKGKYIGSGKGTWIWWTVKSFEEKSKIPSAKDTCAAKVLEIVDTADSPLETTEVVELVQRAIPKCTRTIVFKRLTDLRGDQALKGKYVGSGKGVWTWWRENAF